MFRIAIPWDFWDIATPQPAVDALDVAAIPGNRDVKHRSSLGLILSSSGVE
jgi:hypothetical protein